MTTASTTAERLREALSILREGGVVAFPTDTLYALGADACSEDAVARVYQIKGRAANNPLPLFVAGLGMAEEIALLPSSARKLAAAFWPGGLTVVVPVRPGFETLALAGGSTVALRAPDDAVALSIIAGLGSPVTATSANLSGGADPVTAAEVTAQLGNSVDYVLDGGACPVGVASTIVDCTTAAAKVLRPGAVSEADIRAALAT